MANKCIRLKKILPSIECKDIQEERTIPIPAVEDTSMYVDKCISYLVQPECKKIGLNLPKQVCVEGPPYPEEPKPSYAPAPKPTYSG